jgi:glycosyltransferase involved in cell wall biosynthesis
MCDLISVIVPVFNTGKYLQKCVESILAQDYPKVEIILVDDGSEDELTICLCDNYAARFQNITLVRQENKGAASARNFGVKASRGKYICFIDSDDYIEHDMLSGLYSFVEKYNVKIVLSELVYDNYKKISRPDSIVHEGIYSSSEILHYFLLGFWHSACTVMYNREIFEKNLFPVGETNEDFIFNFNAISSIEKMAVCLKAYYHYVLHNNSVTSTQCNIKNLHWIEHAKVVIKTIKSSPNLENLSGEAFYQYLLSNIILCNKALLSLNDGYQGDSEYVYHIASDNLKASRKLIANNEFLEFRYYCMAYMIALSPFFYRRVVLLGLRMKRLISR